MKRDEEKPARVGQAFLCGDLVVGLANVPNVVIFGAPGAVGVLHRALELFSAADYQLSVTNGIWLPEALRKISLTVFRGNFG